MTLLRRLAAFVEHMWDRLRFSLKRRLGWLGPIEIAAHRGYGTPRSLHLSGRVLEQAGLSAPTPEDSIWTNLRRALARFESDEIPDLALEARYGRLTARARTDAEGYFRFDLDLPQPAPRDVDWHQVELRALETPDPSIEAPRATASVLVPSADADFGVISDIDDTILVSGATRPLTLIARSVFENAETRRGLPGVGALYRAMSDGGRNPIFYLSSGPWNLYDMIRRFLDRQRLPRGPIFLQDWGLDPARWFKATHAQHKKAYCERLLDTYRRLPFVLVGDAGERDADIYAELAEAYGPDRVKAIYIRAVGGSSHARLAKAQERARRVGVEMLEIQRSEGMRQDLMERRLLLPA